VKEIIIKLNTHQDMQIKFHINQIVGYRTASHSYSKSLCGYITIAFNSLDNNLHQAGEIEVPITTKVLSEILEVLHV